MVVGLYADSTLYWLDDALSTANYLICRRCMRLLLDDGDTSFIGDGGEIRMWQPLAMMYLVSTRYWVACFVMENFQQEPYNARGSRTGRVSCRQ